MIIIRKFTSILFVSIFYMLATQSFSASLSYIDPEGDDLLKLAQKFDIQDIDKHQEDLGLNARNKFKDIKKRLEDYSLEKHLIPQVVKSVAEEAIKASRQILALAKPGDTVLYLGRSPSVLLTASHFLAPPDSKESLTHIQVNYSGTPNIGNNRDYKVNELRNVVTEERLLHFCRYLDEKGLGNLTPNDQMYIVDIVGKGGGMNTFLRILLHYYLTYKKIDNTPKITLLLMNFDDRTHVEENCYLYNPKKGDFLFFNSEVTQGAYRSIKVKAHSLAMSEKVGGVLDILDNNLVQYYLLNGREYPAFCWNEVNDEYRNSNPELAPLFTSKLIEEFASIVSKE